MLSCLSQATGVWSNSTLQSILSSQALDTEKGSFPFCLLHLFNPHPLLNRLIYTQHLKVTLMNINGASVCEYLVLDQASFSTSKRKIKKLWAGFNEDFFFSPSVHAFLALEGPTLLEMRIKHLIKENQRKKAALLAKACSEFPEFEGKGHFKQMYLVSLCSVTEQEPLMEEVFSHFRCSHDSWIC